ncbi:hypothetical protein, partial [Pseudonocardia asaccharolytica]|uniref:hypothetical protein n=1 Tax=Pseudonocardia asaccharolytica TaxID=54010 RepID=UPI001B7F9D1B
LRLTPGGLLRIDKKKINAEANLDGKYLLRCSEVRREPGAVGRAGRDADRGARPGAGRGVRRDRP